MRYIRNIIKSGEDKVMFCYKCGANLPDDAAFCNNCGTSLAKRPMFCSSCGADLAEGATFCDKCGTRVADENVNPNSTGAVEPSNTPNSSKVLIDTICQRLQINGIIWIVIGSVQIYIGLTVQWFVMVIGLLNILCAIVDLTIAKNFPQKPVGLIKRSKPLAGHIFILIYNLFVGGVIGVVGSIYYLLAVRQYVINNEAAFRKMEEPYATANL